MYLCVAAHVPNEVVDMSRPILGHHATVSRRATPPTSTERTALWSLNACPSIHRDSGRVTSNDTNGVAYEGKTALQADGLYSVTVVW